MEEILVTIEQPIEFTTQIGPKEEILVTFGEPGPKGDTGADSTVPGPSNVLAIGSVTRGDNAEAVIIGTPPLQVLNLVLPKGDTGEASTVPGPPGVVQSIVAGTDITIDDTDTANPIVSSSATKITVSQTAPSSPSVNDLWVQLP